MVDYQFTYNGINDGYINSICLQNTKNKSFYQNSVSNLINRVGQKMYAIHSFEHGEILRNIGVQSLPKTAFEQQYPTAEAFVKVRPLDRSIEQYHDLLEKARRDLISPQFRNAGKRLANCGILCQSVFASFIGTEGQRLRLTNASPQQGWTKGWWQELIWQNSDPSLRKPIFRVDTPGHGSNAFFIGRVWNETEKKNISNYLFFDIFDAPLNGEKGVKWEEPGYIGLSTSNVIRLSIPTTIILPDRGIKNFFCFYFVKHGQNWNYQVEEPPSLKCECQTSFWEADKDRYISHQKKCEVHTCKAAKQLGCFAVKNDWAEPEIK